MTTAVPAARVPRKYTPKEVEKIEAVKEEAPPPWWSKIDLTVDQGFGGWTQRTNGPFVHGMVRVSDGQWVLPPIKCKEYMQDTVLTKYLPGTFPQFGYKPSSDLIKGQRLAIVFGFPRPLGITDVLVDSIRAGAEGFKKYALPGVNVNITRIPGTLTVSGWKKDGTPIEWDPVVVEYDEKIEAHPAMFSLFMSWLRAGGLGNLSGLDNPANWAGEHTAPLQSLFTYLDAQDWDRVKASLTTHKPRLKLLQSKMEQSAEVNYGNVKKAGLASHSGSGFAIYLGSTNDYY